MIVEKFGPVTEESTHVCITESESLVNQLVSANIVLYCRLLL